MNDLCFYFYGHDTASQFGNTGPLAPGTHSVVWDGTFNDPNFTISDGIYSVYPHFQLEPGGPYQSIKNAGNQTAPTFAYLLVDSKAPRLHAIATRLAAEENRLEVTGYIDDMIDNVLQDAPMVYLNGQELATVNRADPNGPGRGYDYTYFESSLEINVSGEIAFTLGARDRAGNSNMWEYSLTPLVLDNPETDTADGDVYTVSGRVIPGMTVTMAGKEVAVDGDGNFAVETALPYAMNLIEVVATAPGWDSTVPLRRQIQVVRQGSVNVETKFTPRTFNLKSNGQWVSVEASAPASDSFAEADAESIRLLIGGGSLRAVKSEIQGNRLKADFDASCVAELLAAPSEHVVFLIGTINGTAFYGADTVRVISPGE